MHRALTQLRRLHVRVAHPCWAWDGWYTLAFTTQLTKLVLNVSLHHDVEL